MFRILALFVLIFSLMPAAVQARPQDGGQAVTISISLTIAPDLTRQQRTIADCVDEAAHEGRRTNLVICRSNNLTAQVTEAGNDVAVRVKPI